MDEEQQIQRVKANRDRGWADLRDRTAEIERIIEGGETSEDGPLIQLVFSMVSVELVLREEGVID
jgi:hypothetical protein